MAYAFGALTLVMLVSAAFGEEGGPLLVDFIDFLYTSTISPKSCGVQKECVPFYQCKFDVPEDTICGFPDVCCDSSNKIATLEDPLPHEGCGYRSGETGFGEFPWLAAMMSAKEADPLNFYCGAALIAPTAALTTAYCAKQVANDTFLQVGEWIRMEKKDIVHRAHRIEKMISHERYDAPSLTYNLALLIVDSPFQWEENVRPICLPESDITFDETRCYTPGWTNGKPHIAGSQAILKRIDSPLVPSDQCLEKYRPYSSPTFQFDKTTVCAGGKATKDYDIYNSGVPLVCQVPGVEDRYFLAGLESFLQKEQDLSNVRYAAPGTPRAYTNVPLLRKWITDKLAEHGIALSNFS